MKKQPDKKKKEPRKFAPSHPSQHKGRLPDVWLDSPTEERMGVNPAFLRSR